jgi:hypothetical protein
LVVVGYGNDNSLVDSRLLHGGEKRFCGCRPLLGSERLEHVARESVGDSLKDMKVAIYRRHELPLCGRRAGTGPFGR